MIKGTMLKVFELIELVLNNIKFIRTDCIIDIFRNQKMSSTEIGIEFHSRTKNIKKLHHFKEMFLCL